MLCVIIVLMAAIVGIDIIDGSAGEFGGRDFIPAPFRHIVCQDTAGAMVGVEVLAGRVEKIGILLIRPP
jgi:hypothetical protein